MKPGKGAAFVRTKLKHQVTGAAAITRGRGSRRGAARAQALHRFI